METYVIFESNCVSIENVSFYLIPCKFSTVSQKSNPYESFFAQNFLTPVSLHLYLNLKNPYI